MTVNTKTMVSITEANQNFSKVARLVDENGSAVILKNNVPRYIVMEFSEAEKLQTASDEDVMSVSKKLIEKNIRAYKELDGHDLYPSIIQKAARIGYSLVSNHPFIDGNKRIGIHIMLVFLAINGIDISCTQEDLIKIGLSLADDTMNFEELSVWLSSHN